MLLLLVLLVVIVEAGQALRVAAHAAMVTALAHAQAHSLAALLEALVPTIGAVAVLDDQGGVGHLAIVGVLLVPPVVVLDHNGGGAFLVLLFELLSALVRAIRFLDALGRLVELPLLRVSQGELGKISLEGILRDAGGMQELRQLLGGWRRTWGANRGIGAQNGVTGRRLQRPGASRTQAGAGCADVVIPIAVVMEVEAKVAVEMGIGQGVQQRIHKAVRQSRRLGSQRFCQRTAQNHHFIGFVLEYNKRKYIQYLSLLFMF